MSTCLCILGMHRSGTSALTRVVNLLGVTLGNNLHPPSTDNPKGFWEHAGILAIHENLLEAIGSFYDDYLPLPGGWHRDERVTPFRQQLIDVVNAEFSGTPLWGFKDPRTCRLLPMWIDIFQQTRVDARFVVMSRSPWEIVRSLQVRSGHSINKALLLTLDHMLEAEINTRGFPRAIVTFDGLMADWRDTIDRIGRGAGITWPTSIETAAGQITEFLDPGLRHHGPSADGTPAADPFAAAWVADLHAILAASGGETIAADRQRIDAIARAFAADRVRLEGWWQQRSIEHEFMKVEAWGRQQDAAAKRLWDENQWFRGEIARRDAEAGEKPSGPDPKDEVNDDKT